MARPGGVYEPSHEFSLVDQDVHATQRDSFRVRFPNVWESYKFPRITDKVTYDRWLDSQMIFWQMQLNFAIWYATTGCGVTKEHLRTSNPMIRSVFRFHAYYQIRKILSEMRCPLPFENSWDPLNNRIDNSAYERICSEFGVNPRSNWRQKLDPCNGMGYVWYTKTIKQAHGAYRSHYVTIKRVKTKTDTFDSKFEVEGDPVDYIEQTFSRESGSASDFSPDRTPMAAIGSFVMNSTPTGSKEFTRAGTLGAQGQVRSSIVAADAQKQFLANVEDAINSQG